MCNTGYAYGLADMTVWRAGTTVGHKPATDTVLGVPLAAVIMKYNLILELCK